MGTANPQIRRGSKTNPNSFEGISINNMSLSQLEKLTERGVEAEEREFWEKCKSQRKL